MWEDQAQALGWPAKPLGWADILAEAKNTQGWAKYGHPEWGPFRLGHTNPDFSTSGLSAVAAEYYAATGKTEGLTLQDVEDPTARGQVRDIQSSVVHYGDTTLFFAEQLAARGPAFASAVAMEETTLVDYNARLRKGGKRLVAIYPKEGTFFSDNPLIVLDAPWVSADQKAGAAKVVEYLTSRRRPVQGDDRRLPPVRHDRAAGRQPDEGERRRRVAADAPSVAARAEGAGPHPRAVARGPQARRHRAGARHVRLDGRRGQARAGAGGAARVPHPAVAARPGGAGRVLRQVGAGAAVRRDDAGRARHAPELDQRPVPRRRHRGLRRDHRRHRPAAAAGRSEAHRRRGRAHRRRGQQVERRRRRRDREAEGHDGERQRARVHDRLRGRCEPRGAEAAVANAGGGKQYDGDPDNINAVYTSISSFF